jgi:hypothetical protein
MMHIDSGRSPHKPLVALGQVVATPGALTARTKLDVAPLELIPGHVTGGWSDLGAEDQQQSLLAIRSGLRIFSSYNLRIGKNLGHHRSRPILDDASSAR